MVAPVMSVVYRPQNMTYWLLEVITMSEVRSENYSIHIEKLK